MCEDCIYFIYDGSVDACDCAKADELTENDVKCFEENTEGCTFYERYDYEAEDAYYRSLGVFDL